MKTMLDFYSGLGGASEAFVNSGNWQVWRFEIEDKLMFVRNTLQYDLTDPNDLEEIKSNPKYQNPDLIWASPPCTDFSQGYNAPGVKARREGRDFKPDLAPLHSAIELIKALKPKYWVIENVAGASKIFSRELGVNAPRQIIGAYFLWGNFPYIAMPRSWEYKSKVPMSGGDLRPNYRGKVDIEVSKMLLRACEDQKQLTEW